MSSNERQNTDENWLSVGLENDKRPRALPDFLEPVGPTFPVGPNPPPSAFYNEMLPDSLFDYILMCTNTRARVYFHNISSSSSDQEAWKPVRFIKNI